ncbi:hydrolase [Methylomonas sp. ZR1]|uniref:hydrolase n=1 Tax=unclassified Methylomonas TaxID=2608980 RepID=UPI0014912143|nr:hydrolase [Methylomonas sp. ZR1]NOV32377.1 hydrolase [Methylomonas sp. ZR1]
MHNAFRPAWWLNSPHLQTIYPALLRSISPPAGIRRERLDTPDGDFLDIDWVDNGDRPLVILLHGLAGSSRSGYIQGLQHSLLAAGFASVALNFRGCSGEMNRLARCYHSGETEDIEFFYQTLRQRFLDRAMAAIGFSLGGNVLLKWLGEQGDKIGLSAAVAVSVPLLLNECADKLDRGFSKLYRDYLLRELKQYMRVKLKHLQGIGQHEQAERIAELGDLSGIKSFWQYDDKVVAGLHGFKDAHDYYRRSSSRQFLKHIRVPTLILQANDDPFMTERVLPTAAELSDQVQLEVCAGGGHVGFVSGGWFRPAYWLEARIGGFLRQHLPSLTAS